MAPKARIGSTRNRGITNGAYPPRSHFAMRKIMTNGTLSLATAHGPVSYVPTLDLTVSESKSF